MKRVGYHTEKIQSYLQMREMKGREGNSGGGGEQ